MRLIFSQHAWNDYLYWQRTDKKVVKRINPLIQDISALSIRWDRKSPNHSNMACPDTGHDASPTSSESSTSAKMTPYLSLSLRYHY